MHFGLANFPVAYCGLKIITSLSLRFPDFQRWYSKTKHGYARGKEPVIYVDNIRAYIDLLLWYTNHKEIEEITAMPPITLQAH